MPGQVQVGRGYPLLAALARHLHLLPHLHRHRLLAVAALLVAVLPENICNDTKSISNTTNKYLVRERSEPCGGARLVAAPRHGPANPVYLHFLLQVWRVSDIRSCRSC